MDEGEIKSGGYVVHTLEAVIWCLLNTEFDVIIEYFILNRRYNIFEINEMLFYYDQMLLGSTMN